MRTFAEKPKATQQTMSGKSTMLGGVHFGQSREMRSAHHLQHMMENQAIQQLRQGNREGVEASPGAVAATGFGHDFSRILVHSHAYESIQPKLTVNAPGDQYEQEADRVAEQVMRMPTPARTGSRVRTLPNGSSGVGGMLQRADETAPDDEAVAEHEMAPEDDLVASDSEPVVASDEPEKEEQLVQTKSAGARERGRSMGALAASLRSTKAGGRPLGAAMRSYMEPRFGFDFSSVRIHQDSASDRLSRRLGAAAFTHGADIYFRAGRYKPGTSAGQRLLAHELTHVVQQGGGSRGASEGETVRRSLLGAPEFPQISSLGPGSIARYIQAKAEVEVKLSEPNKVRIVDGGKVTKQWDKASAGDPTVSLMEQKAAYSIYEKRKPGLIIGKWGLNYFAMFKDGYGFHSNIAMKRKKGGGRKRVVLTVDGKRRSHGCIRLRHKDAIAFYNSVSIGTPIKLMMNFSKLGGSKGGTRSGKKVHTVQSGDTLSGLADLYGVSQDAIERANPGKIQGKNKVIKIGDTLVIPEAK